MKNSKNSVHELELIKLHNLLLIQYVKSFHDCFHPFYIGKNILPCLYCPNCKKHIINFNKKHYDYTKHCNN